MTAQRLNVTPLVRHDVRIEDRDAVARIVTATGFFRDDEIAVAVELIDERLAKGEPSGYHFVFAEIDGSVAGYACFGQIPCTLWSYDLYWIAVDPAYQKHGLGRLLLQASEKQIHDQGGRRVYIETSGKPQYLPTRAFYERCGYHIDAELADFYGSGDSKIIYVKVLP